MKTPPLLTSLSRLLLLAAVLFGNLAAHAATNFPNVLSVGPLNSAPAYFYINTKIPFNPGVAPQIHITGYMYSGTNKALDVTIGWYMWNNAFLWTQYQSSLSFAKPSRIRLGTYDDAGTTRVRIEIANDGVYWTSYFVSATDILGYDPYYIGWTYVEGTMPATTGLITEVPLQGDVQIFGNLTANNFNNGTISGSSSGLTLNAGGSSQNVTLTPSGSGYTILNGNVGIGTAIPGAKLQVGSWTRIKDGTWADPATPNAVSAGERLVFYEGGGWKTGIGMGSGNDIWFQAHTPAGYAAFRWFTGGSSVAPAERMRIMEGGNVGIGTLSPQSKLHLHAASHPALQITDDTSGSSSVTNGLYIQQAGVNAYLWNYEAGDMYLGVDGSTDLTIRSGGNVGIGTTSPGAPLEIGTATGANFQSGLRLSKNGGYGQSDIQSYYLSVSNYGLAFNIGGAGSAQMVVNNSGNIGIGTPAPAKKLHVAGTGSMQVDPDEGSIELASGNDGMSYIDFKGSTNLGADYRGRMLYADGTGFIFSTGQSYTNEMVIREGGNVGIGTTNPGLYKLAVNGTIHAKEIIVDNTNWADYVFDSNYRLAPLSEVEQHIKTEKHLPGIPSAAEIAEHGVSMGDMQSKLLSKIEEITLHQIAQEKEISALKAQNILLQQQLAALKAAANP